MYNNADVISETYEDVATGKLQIRRFQRPHSRLTTLLRETPSNINKRYCQKLESVPYIFVADSMGLCLLVFTQLSLNVVEHSESKSAGTKTVFYMK